MPSRKTQEKKTAFALYVIILLGFVSLLGDIIYEGARSVSGPYIGLLGAGAAIIGLVSGLGEFIGYALRLVSGYIADRSECYWLMTFIGYGLLISVPLLAVAGCWEMAAVLLILERIGKAIRSPSRDAILSHATKQVGRGWGFGIHEAMDQIGGIAGPLLFSLVFIMNGSYENGFAVLSLPFILMIAILFIARRKVPSPTKLESDDGGKPDGKKGRLPRIFWIYTLFIMLAVAGFANFQLISYHLKISSIASDAELPLFYALAMGVDGLVALIIGKFYDRSGMRSLVLLPSLTIPIPFLAFTDSYSCALVSVVLWGAVMGIHETVMRAAIADMSSVHRRGLAYGIFNTTYGASWFLGGTLMGVLYEISIPWIALFALIFQLISIPLLYILIKGCVR